MLARARPRHGRGRPSAAASGCSGPLVTARYGGALLWLATLSILFQVVYNMEISRYTLYTGEPIFTGKFRIAPGPAVLALGVPGPRLRLVLPLPRGERGDAAGRGDARAGSPSAQGSLHLLGDERDRPRAAAGAALRLLPARALPLVFGGKVYNSLKAVMSFKIVVVLGFLRSSPSSTPTRGRGGRSLTRLPSSSAPCPSSAAEDANGNGRLDPGEDWDRDGRLDVRRAALLRPSTPTATASPTPGRRQRRRQARQVRGPGRRRHPRRRQRGQRLRRAVSQGRALPKIDLSLIGLLAAMAAIAGQRRPDQHPDHRLHARPGLGHGLARRRDAQRRRRARSCRCRTWAWCSR